MPVVGWNSHEDGSSIAWGALSFAVVSTLYIGWRLWKFTILPFLKPKEPLIYPYLIPGLGHAIPFFNNSYKLFDDASEYFGDARPVYSLVIAGRSMYVVTNPKDAQELYKNAKSLSWESFIKDLFVWLGYSSSSVETLWRPPTQVQRSADPTRDRAPVFMMEKQQRAQCLPGDKSRAMTAKLLEHVQHSMQWESLLQQPFTEKTSPTTLEVDAYSWTSQTFILALTEVYWGRKILEINPRLLSDYAEWENLTWKYVFQLPRLVSKDMYSARDRLISTFSKYFELDETQRMETNWWVPTAEKEFRNVGLDSTDVGRAHMLEHWAVNGNMHKVSFWMLLEILHDDSLREVVDGELRQGHVDGKLNTDVYEKDCPQLDAVWHEVLRMRMTTSLARKVTSETAIGDRVLKSGYDVVVPYKVLHNDEAVWGASPERFDKRRFLNRPDLTSHPSYRPFGGGAHLCPGRFLGKKVIYSFLAITLSMKPRLNQKKGCANCFPRPRDDKPALGSLGPVPADRVFIQLRKE